MDFFKEWVVSVPASTLGKIGAVFVVAAIAKEAFGTTIFADWVNWVFNEWTGLAGLAAMAVQRRADD